MSTIHDENKYRAEVRLDDDGTYRWSYRYDRYHDRKMYRMLLWINAGIAVCGFIAGFLLKGFVCGLLGYAAFFAAGCLILALIRLMEGGSSLNWFEMTDEYVMVQPSGRGSGINRFSEVRSVIPDEEHNEIRMRSRFGRCSVLVRHEDFPLVRDHILSHVPESAVIGTPDASVDEH